MKIRAVFPGLLTALSPIYFSVLWSELSNVQVTYHEFYIDDERQSRLEDADGLPYSLDYLVLEELDLLQTLLKAPPVKAELQQQLQSAGQAATTASWLPEMLKLVGTYAQITPEEEGLWDIDVNLFLSEETSVTANYTPRTSAADLVIKLGEWLHSTSVEALLGYVNVIFSNSSSTYENLFAVDQLLLVIEHLLTRLSPSGGNTVKQPFTSSTNCSVNSMMFPNRSLLIWPMP